MVDDPAPRQKRHPCRSWLIALGTVLALLGAFIGGAWWLWRTDAGIAWLIRQVPGLQVTDMRGRPDGGPFEAARVEWRSGDLHVEISGLSWRDMDWQWHPYPGAWLRLTVIGPQARRVAVSTGAAGAETVPANPPADLRLPLELIVHDAHLGVLQLNRQPPVTELTADLHLGDDSGARHRLARLTGKVENVLARAQGEVATTGTLALAGRIDITTLQGTSPPWHAEVGLRGSVVRLDADAALTVAADTRLNVQAGLAPFSPWPLASLRAKTSDLDLSTLVGGWPSTDLSGHARFDSSKSDVPAEVHVELSNATPGTVDEGKLPLRHLRVVAQGRPDDRSVVDFTALEVQLEGKQPAGRVSGTGHWLDTALSLDLTLDSLRPSQIDRRMAAMSLTGPLRLALRGMPSPAPAASPRKTVPLSGEVHGELAGSLEGPRTEAVHIAVDATGAQSEGAWQMDIGRLLLTSGASRARLEAMVRHDAQRLWRVRTQGEFSKLDPAAWWAGPEEVRWRRGPHSLNGSWSAELAWPAGKMPAEPRIMAEALRGNARLHLHPSRLAGVRLDGTATLVASDSGTVLESRLVAARNHLAVDLRTRARDEPDRWRAEVRAPVLAALTPLAEFIPGSSNWLPQAGALHAQAVAEGRWPIFQTQGELHARSVRSDAWRVGSADASWAANLDQADAPLSLTLAASNLAHGAQRIDQLEAELNGTLRSHRLLLMARSPLRPPAWTDAAPGSGSPPARGSALRLEAAGGWQQGVGRAGTWRGRLAELLATTPGPRAMPWVAANDVEARLDFDREGELVQAVLAPGRAELLGATLHWAQASFEEPLGPGEPPRLRLQARLEPLQVAPWLSRWKPHFGWGGDLRMQGSIDVRSGERFHADVVVQRTGGDLTLTDENGTRRLGLTDLRIGLAADQGTWHFTQALAGSNVGVFSGAQTVRVPQDAAWPPAQAPLEGVLELRVADLGAWGAWLPPGWRLGGQLRTTAALGGRFGAPEYTGNIVGSDLSLRNLLEGVHLRDGFLDVALRGAEARIERFVFKGGPGLLQIDGGANFGASPQAQLRIVADHLAALDRLDRRIVLSGQADLLLQAQRLALDGRFVVDEGLIDVSQASAPQLDEDVEFADPPVDKTGQPRRRRPGTEADGKGAAILPDNTDVSLLIELGNDLLLRGRGLETELTGQLRISTPVDELAVNGIVRVTSGTYTAYGQNLSVEHGILRFTGDVAAPQLDVLALRPDIDARVGISIQGNATEPRIRLFSEPEMSEIDKLSWLVMGRPSEGLGTADMALMQRAALALLAGEESGSTGALLENIGLDDLSIRQAESGGETDTVVGIGKQLSDRLYVGYERGINALSGSWQLIYRVARRFTLRAQSGEDSAIDVIWTWRWD